MHKKLRSWALENLNILSLKSIANKVNELLEPHLSEDPAILTNCDLSFRVQPSSVRRWMDNLEFKCFPVKKSHMMNTHEREDVVKERVKHIKKKG